MTYGAAIQDRTNLQKGVLEHVKVEEGDLLKFGRVRFRIKKMHITK